MFVRAYLRASTTEQDAERARGQLDAFAAERGLTIAAWYVENESGSKLARPELFRLLKDARPGDMLLVEQVDRLSRLTSADWEKLKVEIAARSIRVVALDLPTSWMMATTNPDEFTGRMFAAINSMMLDMLAAVARKDYEDRRRRQTEGQLKAKEAGVYKGRPEDKERNAGIADLLAKGVSWSQIQAATGCSRATIAKVAKRAA
ncbi:recombinase family protein [Methylobacterium gossipiicola]|uniref:Site-specific DNA recombinase n=1 Tax=Methylobacterium gossipiicola TaxID=582675 RepID=A0A1I2TEK0_9HYPH|nr:recombinase family protein [Methylobacterium gossipiicola]SFG63215.1 Site-specific DNA recombinase [Methylobacterium gossipiicola]